jgi:hypothetical protein
MKLIERRKMSKYKNHSLRIKFKDLKAADSKNVSML